MVADIHGDAVGDGIVAPHIGVGPLRDEVVAVHVVEVLGAGLYGTVEAAAARGGAARTHIAVAHGVGIAVLDGAAVAARKGGDAAYNACGIAVSYGTAVDTRKATLRG